MAHFPYLATWDDFWDMAEIIEQTETFTYIPGVCYSSPQALRLDSLRTDSYRTLLRQHGTAGCIYIWSPDFSCKDVIMREAEPSGYVVEQQQPMLLWGATGDFVESNDHDARRTFEFASESEWPQGGVRKLNCGMLSYPDEYQDPTGRWHKRSPELKAAYQRVCSHMKKVMVRHKFKSYIWMGREAHQLVKEGKAVVIAHV